MVIGNVLCAMSGFDGVKCDGCTVQYTLLCIHTRGF